MQRVLFCICKISNAIILHKLYNITQIEAIKFMLQADLLHSLLQKVSLSQHHKRRNPLGQKMKSERRKLQEKIPTMQRARHVLLIYKYIEL